jgi:tetratricopeptide (TPR) repeat protein
MPVCPFGTHRLRLDLNSHCQSCGNDLSLYAGVLDVAARFYNEGLRQFELGDHDQALSCLRSALQIRQDLAEAHWLVGFIEFKQGRIQSAREALGRAQSHGAAISVDEVIASILGTDPSSETNSQKA